MHGCGSGVGFGLTGRDLRPCVQVYDLFTDNSRVHEYNEYCKEVTDLAWLDPATKVHKTVGTTLDSRDHI